MIKVKVDGSHQLWLGDKVASRLVQDGNAFIVGEELMLNQEIGAMTLGDFESVVSHIACNPNRSLN